MTFAPMLAFVFFMASGRSNAGAQPGQLQTAATVALVFSLPIALAGFAVRARIRCHVCGLNIPSCVEARVAGSRRWEWVAALEVCPSCEDDGTASPESQARWRESGRQAEDPYWNLSRVAIVIAAIAIMLVGLSLL
jgi:hypothetical protein